MLLRRSVIRDVTHFLKFFKAILLKKRLGGLLRYYGFWNQRIEIYQIGIFWSIRSINEYARECEYDYHANIELLSPDVTA